MSKRAQKKQRGRPAAKPKSDFSKRLDHILGGEKISHFAERAGLSHTTVGRYYKGGEPTLEALQKIHEATGVDLNWLAMGEGEPYPDEDEARVERDRIRIPSVGMVAADDSQGARVQFFHDCVAHDDLEISPQTAVMEVTGNSMAPLVRHGQRVILDVNDRTAHDGDLVVVETTDEETYFKRFFKDNLDRDWIILESVNPLAPERPIRLPWAKVNRMHVVVGVWYG